MLQVEAGREEVVREVGEEVMGSPWVPWEASCQERSWVLSCPQDSWERHRGDREEDKRGIPNRRGRQSAGVGSVCYYMQRNKGDRKRAVMLQRVAGCKLNLEGPTSIVKELLYVRR